MNNVIMAITIDKRSTAIPTVQQILTTYGDIIHLRLGFHDIHHEHTDENGQIILQLKGDGERIHQLNQELSTLSLVKVAGMTIE